jgi:HEAT repeats
MVPWRVQVGLSHADVRWLDSWLGRAMLRAAATRQVLASVFVVTVAALASAPPATAGDPVAKDVPTSVVLAPPGLIVIDKGRVTVDAHDADLADVLSELGARAEFRLRISGQLGRVTTTFTAMSVEQALRRLVQDHELMLVYSAPPDESVRPKLIQADVFASTPSAAQVRAASEMLGRQRAVLLAEINRLRRSRNVERDAPRLAELLGSAPDSIVRARAASALAALSGPLSQAALARALGDSAPDVRVQAIRALRSVDGARAIPTLGRVLLTDPDVTVRRAAAQMLGSLQDPAATSALSVAAEDADALVRREVSRALNRRDRPTSP